MQKVLIIDDSPTSILMFKSLLQPFDVDITSAQTLGDAFDAIAYEEQTYSLAIIDLNFNESMNGLDFIKCLRKTITHKDTPAIMITARLNSDVENKCKALNTLACFNKEKSSSPQIAKTLEKILNKKKTS